MEIDNLGFTVMQTENRSPHTRGERAFLNENRVDIDCRGRGNA